MRKTTKLYCLKHKSILHTAPTPSINKVSQIVCSLSGENRTKDLRMSHWLFLWVQIDDNVTVYPYASRCSRKGLSFQLCNARNLYSINKCELCFHCFKAMCSAHKRTIQQVPDFIHVDLKVGDLQKNKKHGDLIFVKKKKKVTQIGKECKGCSLCKYAKCGCCNLSSTGSGKVLSSIRRLWYTKGEKHNKYCRIIMVYISWFIDAWQIPLSQTMWGLHQRPELNFHWMYHSLLEQNWVCTSLLDNRSNERMNRHILKITPTFMWNSKFSFRANICSKMSSEIRGMIPIPWGSWRFPYEKKETR